MQSCMVKMPHIISILPTAQPFHFADVSFMRVDLLELLVFKFYVVVTFLTRRNSGWVSISAVFMTSIFWFAPLFLFLLFWPGDENNELFFRTDGIESDHPSKQRITGKTHWYKCILSTWYSYMLLGRYSVSFPNVSLFYS